MQSNLKQSSRAAGSWQRLCITGLLALCLTGPGGIAAEGLTAQAAPGPQAPAPAGPPATPPPVVRADAEAVAQLLAAIRQLNLPAGFSAKLDTSGVLKDNKVDVAWSTTGDLTWRRDFVYEFHLAPKGSGYRAAHGLSTGQQRYLVFTEEGRFATRSVSHMNPTLTDVFAGTEGEHYLFNSLYALAMLTAAPPAPTQNGPAGAAETPLPPADPIAAVWGDCKLAVTRDGATLTCRVTLLPDLGDQLTIAIAPGTVTFTADRSQRLKNRLQDDPPAPGVSPGQMIYTERWTLAAVPADFTPVWALPKTDDGKDFKEITLNAFGRDQLADRLVGQTAPALVVDSFPPVYDVNFGPGMPAGWGPLPGIVAPRVMPHFNPLPTDGPKEIEWSEEPAKAAKIVDRPVTLGDLLKRYPDRPVAVVFVATWTAASQTALKDLAGWQSQNAPVLVVCNENTQTLIDDLGRRALPVSVCRDPQGRNGVRFGVDDYPMVYLIGADRTIQAIQRGWVDAEVKQLKAALRLP